jgi:hypothetical protein
MQVKDYEYVAASLGVAHTHVYELEPDQTPVGKPSRNNPGELSCTGLLA